MSRPAISWREAAVSTRVRISAASSSRIVTRSFRLQPISGLLRLFDDHPILAVVLAQPDRDALALGRGQVLADEIRTDRKLSVTPIDQDRELNHSWSSQIDQRVERGPDRPSRVEHVVHQDDGLVLDRERDVGAADHRGAAHVEVVPVEGDVERADRHRGPVDGRDLGGQPLGERHAAGPQADEGELLGAAVLFEDLVRDAGEGAVEGDVVENLRFFAQAGRSGAHYSPYEPHGARLKEEATSAESHSTRVVSLLSMARRAWRVAPSADRGSRAW